MPNISLSSGVGEKGTRQNIRTPAFFPLITSQHRGIWIRKREFTSVKHLFQMQIPTQRFKMPVPKASTGHLAHQEKLSRKSGN